MTTTKNITRLSNEDLLALFNQDLAARQAGTKDPTRRQRMMDVGLELEKRGI